MEEDTRQADYMLALGSMQADMKQRQGGQPYFMFAHVKVGEWFKITDWRAFGDEKACVLEKTRDVQRGVNYDDPTAPDPDKGYAAYISGPLARLKGNRQVHAGEEVTLVIRKPTPNERQEKAVLLAAANSHNRKGKRGDHKATAYGNFVECSTCGAHAHIQYDVAGDVQLVKHDRTYTKVFVINSWDF